MAFLSCRKLGVDYLIVQTGGPEGRVFLAIDRGATTVVATNANPREAMCAVITNYLNVSREEEIPDFKIEKRGTLIILKPVKPNKGRNKLTLAEGLLSNTQVAISIDKWCFSDSVPRTRANARQVVRVGNAKGFT